jgi:hypothetical protein
VSCFYQWSCPASTSAMKLAGCCGRHALQQSTQHAIAAGHAGASRRGRHTQLAALDWTDMHVHAAGQGRRMLTGRPRSTCGCAGCRRRAPRWRPAPATAHSRSRRHRTASGTLRKGTGTLSHDRLAQETPSACEGWGCTCRTSVGQLHCVLKPIAADLSSLPQDCTHKLAAIQTCMPSCVAPPARKGSSGCTTYLSTLPEQSPCTVRTQGAHGEGDHGGQRLIRHEEAGQVQHCAVAAERDAEVRVCM